MTNKVCDNTITTLINMVRDCDYRIPQMETGITAAKQHIAGKEAAVRVFKRILRDTKNEERIGIITKCLEDAEWELGKYKQELERYESETEELRQFRTDLDLIIKNL